MQKQNIVEELVEMVVRVQLVARIPHEIKNVTFVTFDL